MHADRAMTSEAIFARHLLLLRPDDDCISCSRRVLEVFSNALGVMWGLDASYEATVTLEVTVCAQNHAYMHMSFPPISKKGSKASLRGQKRPFFDLCRPCMTLLPSGTIAEHSGE